MLSNLKAGVGLLLAVIAASCAWRLFEHWPVVLGLVVAVGIAVLAANRRFGVAAVVAVISSFVAGAVIGSTKGAVWLGLVAGVLSAVMISQWGAFIRPRAANAEWWKNAERAERNSVKDIVATWPEIAYHSGLTTVDNRRRGLGIWAWSDSARRADQRDRLADGDEGKRTTPQLVSITGTNVGYWIEAAPCLGQSDDDWTKATSRLAKSWGVPDVRVMPGSTAGLVALHVIVDSGMGEVVLYGDQGRQEHQVMTPDAVPFGIDELGEPVTIRLTESSILLGGEPGGGKSGGQTAIIAGAAQCSNVALLGIDPKRVELSPWRRRFTEIVTTPEAGTDMLTRLVQEMDRRYDMLELNEQKKLSVFTPEVPLIALFIDELAEILAAGVTKEEIAAEKERATLLRRIEAKGRAAGIFLSMATQKPDADTIPTRIRDLVPQRAAYRTGSRAMTETIMGAGRSEDALAHQIDGSAKGLCYLIAEGSPQPRLVRTHWIPDEEVVDWASRTAHLKPTWTLDAEYNRVE